MIKKDICSFILGRVEKYHKMHKNSDTNGQHSFLSLFKPYDGNKAWFSLSNLVPWEQLLITNTS
jgi:hypothetical protein